MFRESDKTMKINFSSVLDAFFSRPLLVLFFCIACSLLWVVVGFNSPLVFLTENQNLYIYSTQAQVLAGIYGLMLAGYIFLRNEQTRRLEKDETLDGVIKSVQKKEFGMLIVITITTMVTIILDLLVLSLYLSAFEGVNILIKNTAASLFVLSLIMISFFIFQALKETKYEQAVQDIMRQEEGNIQHINEINVSASSVNADKNRDLIYGTFMNSFRMLERMLGVLYSNIYNNRVVYKLANEQQINSKKNKVHVPISRMLRDLVSSGIIDAYFGEEISSIIRYRNALVHTTETDPSQKMVDRISIVIEKINGISREQFPDFINK